ncbi:hypothetical protein PRZ48_005396 [Zasmidium cellare]|uniref:Uncharacterized protein n=1 Tax=Zasmidium cellare TaxID=395010 RepID=A0ABR0ETN3_ZASCE|nr:hypothetical protein PRZ48_005396 [Zasmidium cellare]
MPSRTRPRVAMYNTPAIRTGGFGALQLEAVTNRPLSIARRHLAASQLRMRDIEPHELSSSEWVRFLAMEDRERERFISDFTRRRRGSSSSSSEEETIPYDRQLAYDKAEEARLEAEEARRQSPGPVSPSPRPVAMGSRGSTPFVSLWARNFDEIEQNERTDTGPSNYTARRPMHTRHAVDVPETAPPSYDFAVRSGEAPPAYEPRSDDEGEGSSGGRRERIRRWSSQYLLNRI